MLKILMVGDINGSPGRTLFANLITRMKAEGKVDFVVVNGENAAGGNGITQNMAEELFAAGADVITLGDHTWNRKELAGEIDNVPNLIRPANFAPGCPGRGFTTLDTQWGRISVINLIGRVFMKPMDCPFRAVDRLLKHEVPSGGIILVDFHAEATSEKVVMGRHLDGRVTAVVGTHTHVQTSDECILPNGTAYLTDLGMTGPKDSAIGRDWKPVLKSFMDGMPARFEMATGDVKLEGLMISIDETSGRAKKLKRVRLGL